MLSNCGVEKTPESPLDCKEIKPSNLKGKKTLNIHQKDWCWSWSTITFATWCKEPTHWKRPWCQERLKAGGEGDDRGWMRWLDSIINSMDMNLSKPQDTVEDRGAWLQSMRSQRVGHDLATEQQRQPQTKRLSAMRSSPLWSQLLVAQTVKRLPTMRETRVQSLGWEDPLEKEMATHSSILAWKIPWMEKPGRIQSVGS